MANYNSIHSGSEIDAGITKVTAMPAASDVVNAVNKVDAMPSAANVTAAVSAASLLPGSLGEPLQSLVVNLNGDGYAFRNIYAPSVMGAPNTIATVSADGQRVLFRDPGTIVASPLYVHHIAIEANDGSTSITTREWENDSQSFVNLLPENVTLRCDAVFTTLTRNADVYADPDHPGDNEYAMGKFLDDVYSWATSDTGVNKYRYLPVTGYIVGHETGTTPTTKGLCNLTVPITRAYVDKDAKLYLEGDINIMDWQSVGMMEDTGWRPNAWYFQYDPYTKITIRNIYYPTMSGFESFNDTRCIIYNYGV